MAVQVVSGGSYGPHWSEAMRTSRSSGELGALRTVKVWAAVNRAEVIQVRPDEPIPAGVDYDMWLASPGATIQSGTAFTSTFAGSGLCGRPHDRLGCSPDRYRLVGDRAQYPNRVMSSGKFADPGSAMETPDTQQAIYEYARRLHDDLGARRGIGSARFNEVTASHSSAVTTVHSSSIVQDGRSVRRSSSTRGGESSYEDDGPSAPRAWPEARGLNQHTANFVDCMRTRFKPNCDVASGNLAAINTPLGNIALRTGDTLEWDSVKYRFQVATARQTISSSRTASGPALPGRSLALR